MGLSATTATRKARRFVAAFATTAAALVAGEACGRTAVQARGPAPSAVQEICAPNARPDSLEKTLPELHAAFQKVAALPLTGRNIARQISKPSAKIQTCVVSAFPSDQTRGDFNGSTLKMRVLGGRMDSRVYVHEMFHAAQKVNGSFSMLGSSTMRIEDAIEGNMLIEATAVGYAFVVHKELSKTDPIAYVDFAASPNAYNMRTHFDTAYAAALEKHKNRRPHEQEKKALEAGGRAVVRALLEGRDSYWLSNYTALALSNRNKAGGADIHRYDFDYAAKRRRLYLNAGAVSSGLNLTPPELVGTRAVEKIDALLKVQGISFTYR